MKPADDGDEFDTAQTIADDDEDRTPTVMNPCPDCGTELVIIGVHGVPPPEVSAEIWTTIFSVKCVKTPLWRWCAKQGHLSVWVTKP